MSLPWMALTMCLLSVTKRYKVIDNVNIITNTSDTTYVAILYICIQYIQLPWVAWDIHIPLIRTEYTTVCRRHLGIDVCTAYHEQLPAVAVYLIWIRN